MLISSTLCRAQEALQHRRAAESALDNVKAVAMKAAAAWAAEALLAERRELRQNRPALEGETLPWNDDLSEYEPNETPDIGEADVRAISHPS